MQGLSLFFKIHLKAFKIILYCQTKLHIRFESNMILLTYPHLQVELWTHKHKCTKNSFNNKILFLTQNISPVSKL